MPQKVKLILNPVADMGNAWRVANDLRPIIAEFGQADWSGTVYPTHATELARQAGEQGYQRVIAIGGDGTVHEVVNGLMQLPKNKRPILGIVPVGSGNDFAHAIGVPLQSDQAMKHALHAAPSLIDIGRITDENGRQEFFDNTLGIGFDAVVTIRSHKLPLLRGFLMYLVAVLQTIIVNHHPAHMIVQSDSGDWEQDTIMLTLCNGPREGGGFMVAPDAKIDDGLLHYVTIGKVSRAMMLRLVPEVMQGTHGRFKQVKMGVCKKLSLVSDSPLYIHADGEIYSGFGTTLSKVDFKILPKALQVVRG